MVRAGNHEYAITRRRLLGAMATCWLAGCGDVAPPFTGLIPHDKPLAEAMWQVMIRMLDGIAPELRPEFTCWLAPATDWPQARTLSVSELADEELAAQSKLEEIPTVGPGLKKDRKLQRDLRHIGLTLEQLNSLVYCAGLAISRTLAPARGTLANMERRGRAALLRLKKDQRIYAHLSADERYLVSRDSIWILRLQVIQKLQQVPPETLEAVAKQEDWIKTSFPARLRPDPTPLLVDRLLETGVPFEELPAAGTDRELKTEEVDIRRTQNLRAAARTRRQFISGLASEQSRL